MSSPSPLSRLASPRTLTTLLAILPVHALVTAAVWRDLGRRDASRVRGPKLMWRWLSAANTAGAVGYVLVGRR